MGIERFSGRVKSSLGGGRWEVDIFHERLGFSSIVSVMVKQFLRGGGRGKKNFRDGFKLFLRGGGCN